MWLIREMHNTVEKTKIGQDEIALKVIMMQETLYSMLKVVQKAQETRDKMDTRDDSDTSAKVEMEMAASKPIQFVALPDIC